MFSSYLTSAMARVKLSNFYVFSFLALFSLINLVKCNVPVLLWESSSISDKDDLIPALFQLDSDEFENHLVKKVHQHNPLLVLFLEESLSVEDFSWKDDHGQSSFPQLQNLTSMSAKTEFITSVYDPVAALQDLADSQDYKWVKYDGKKLPSKSRAVLEVRLADPSSDEDRPELLRRHDSSIAEIYSKLLSQYSHIVALFTGKYSSWVEPDYNRIKRDAANETDKSPSSTEKTPAEFSFVHEFPDKTFIMIESPKPPVLKTEEGQTVLNAISGSFQDSKKALSSIILTFADKTRLRFSFSKTATNWNLASVVLNDSITLKSSDDITRPLGSAYIRDRPIDFVNGTTKLMFSNVKIQAYSAEKQFGENPTYYFTWGILMGIFITVILGLILSWAIIMMMDIKTMDRFDDPKGKTITVAQGE